MIPLRAFAKTMAVLGFALAFAASASMLPTNAYQRWQLVDGTDYGTLRWDYERIHFDPRPVDIAIVGPSKCQLGLSAARIEEQLSMSGKPANVVNFSVVAAGRNTDWTIIDELFKTKSPKLIVVCVDASPHPYGHPAFKYVAPAEAIALPPAPLLHNYLYDLAYLPFRQLKLFGAWLFPDLFGLRKQFDPGVYARTRSDFTTSFVDAGGKLYDMDRVISRETLIAATPPSDKPTAAARVLGLFNEGDDHVYLHEIARLARAHGARLMFMFFPSIEGPTEISDRAFLERYGEIVDLGDMSRQDNLYSSWSHFNHAGAMIASDRLAGVIAGLDL
jgi:hypothetical protein